MILVYDRLTRARVEFYTLDANSVVKLGLEPYKRGRDSKGQSWP